MTWLSGSLAISKAACDAAADGALAASLAALSPLSLIGKAHYCWALIGITVLFMLWPARKPAPAASAA